LKKLSEVIGKSFYEIHKDIKENKNTHYWLNGGRGSLKSSFASIEVINGMMRDSQNGEFTNAVVLRKVEKYLRDSVFQQLLWAIDILGVDKYWESHLSPLSIKYKPTGQTILFRGADEPKKIKSTKFKKGYCKYIWYEELDEFNGMQEIRLINQSLMRGGKNFKVLYTYNPPKTVNSWVNIESKIEVSGRIVHKSDYTTVNREWLGETFINEAEQLKLTNPTAYEHEYKGEVTGTGGEIFTNATHLKITDSEILRFDNIKRGLDWGYATDPATIIESYFDSRKKVLYIYREFFKHGCLNKHLAEYLMANNPFLITTCDSAEPKSIEELKSYGIKVVGAKKGQGSIEFGIKWLQQLELIVIDKNRCPNTYREITTYQLEPDGNGGFKNNYPDKNNHCIDAIRYSREDEINSRIIKYLK
jgi:phage terminase large subunit